MLIAKAIKISRLLKGCRYAVYQIGQERKPGLRLLESVLFLSYCFCKSRGLDVIEIGNQILLSETGVPVRSDASGMARLLQFLRGGMVGSNGKSMIYITMSKHNLTKQNCHIIITPSDTCQ